MSTLIVSEKQRQLARELIDHDPAPAFTAAEGDQDVKVAGELNELLHHLLRTVAEGGSLTVKTLPSELSTTVAADELGVSRPTLMRMIKDGEIPAHKVGSHHRLDLADVKAFRRARLKRQREALDELLELEGDLE